MCVCAPKWKGNFKFRVTWSPDISPFPRALSHFTFDDHRRFQVQSASLEITKTKKNPLRCDVVCFVEPFDNWFFRSGGTKYWPQVSLIFIIFLPSRSGWLYPFNSWPPNELSSFTVPPVDDSALPFWCTAASSVFRSCYDIYISRYFFLLLLPARDFCGLLLSFNPFNAASVRWGHMCD